MERKHKAMNWGAFITALATAAGTFGYGQLTSGDRDVIKTKFATEHAVGLVWREDAAKDIDDLQKQVQALREAIIKLQVTADMLARGRRDRRSIEASTRDVAELLQSISDVPQSPRVSKTRKRPSLQQQQQYKENLFPVAD